MIVGVGEIVLDILIKDGKAMAAVPGGSVFNAMVSLGRTLKNNAAVMVSQTGDDKVYDLVKSFMMQNNISHEFIECVPNKQSTVSLALLDKDSNASYEFFRDKDFPTPSVPQITFTPSDMLLFGSFFAVDSKTRPLVQSLASKAYQSIVYYDINFRKSHSPNTAAIMDNCRLSTIVRASNEDIENLALTENPSNFFILTSGKDPTQLFWNGIHLTIPSPTITPVSTIGAGDNFNAGFLYALSVNGITRSDLPQLGPDTLSVIVDTAHRFASTVCCTTENYVPIGFTV